MSETIISGNISQYTQKNPDAKISFFSPKTGIYTSKHPHIKLPNDPYLDIVSHIFSYPNNGGSGYIDSLSGYSIPYSLLFPLVKSTAYSLNEMGISKGDIVLIMLPNSIYFPILFLGVLYLGAIVVPMNPYSTSSEVAHQTASLNISLTFSLGENGKKLRDLGLKVVEVSENVELSSHFCKIIYGNIGKNVPKPKLKQDDTAVILFSSGTTGTSKGVVLTHKNLISTVEQFARFEASQYREENSWENVYLAVLPMFHIYGLTLFVVGLISLGTSVVVMTKFDINQVVKAIERYKVTHYPSVPSMVVALTTKAKSLGGKNRLTSLKQVSAGAASVRTKVISDFLDTFPWVDFIQGYGMTESTAVACRGFNDGEIQKHTSVGLMAPNMEAKVLNLSNGLCLPPGKVGELLLRGPAIMKGYLNNIEATKLTIEEDGWLHTGDLAYFDHDGYLYIVDRIKEMIKYKGYQIAPADLEAILISHPEILDVTVIAAPDDIAGEIPVAFVVRKPGSLLCRDEILKHVANKVAPYKKVRQVVFVTSLPRTPSGKILKRKLKDLLPSKM